MKKLMIYLPEEIHDVLRELAFRNKTTMAALIRGAIEETYEDDIDAIVMERELEEYARDPSSAVSWEDFKASMARGVRA